MIHENIELTGSFTVSGSFVLPSHASSSAVYETGSLYHDSVNGVLKVYTGTQWVTVGEQTASAAGGGAAAGANIEYLLVAGGGGAAADSGGGAGGGAGGLLSSSLSSVTSGSSFTITVGGGGAGYYSGGVAGPAGDGTDSSIAEASISTITSIGGGGAGSSQDTGTIYLGHDGGSGGGSGNGNANYTRPDGGSGTVGQGNDGGGAHSAGVNNGNNAAGGGGGAGAVGADATSGAGGNGGDGLQSPITGTSAYYAGGGAGGTRSSGTAGTGGQGGGGNANNTTDGTGQDGDANTGGGAGGSRSTPTAAGGSGVAIFAYPTGSLSGTGGIKTTRSDGYMVHTFNSSGTLTIAGAGEYPVANGSVFAPVLYTGNSTNDQSITGVGFQPDFVWIKSRNTGTGTAYHGLWDSVRGTGGHLYASITNAETNTPNRLYSFDSDGFSLGNGSDPEYIGNQNYVAWCWKASNTTVTDSSTGDITADIRANQDAGFSIVSYTGSGTSGDTVPHGLSSTPQLTLIKNRDASTNWDVSFDGITGGTSLNLDTTAKVFSPTLGYHVAGASTLTLNSGGSGVQRVNTLNEKYIAYCFHSVAGYQKVGSYTGTGSSQSITGLGFQPRFLLLKNSSAVYEWVIVDSVRGGSNELNPNSTVTENGTGDPADITFDSDGFTLNNGEGATNQNNGNIIYLAIA